MNIQKLKTLSHGELLAFIIIIFDLELLESNDIVEETKQFTEIMNDQTDPVRDLVLDYMIESSQLGIKKQLIKVLKK